MVVSREGVDRIFYSILVPVERIQRETRFVFA